MKPARRPLPLLSGTRHWLSGRTGRRAHRTYRVRLVVQSLFAVTSVLLGIQFARFVSAAEAGAAQLPARPPGVEGFLPISGVMGLVDWIRRGSLNAIHPAATALVIVALVLALLLRKSFCSWICPIGFASELLARFGRWAFGRNFRPWRWLDVLLRGLKYLLLAFFLGTILAMGSAALAAFIDSPYNRVADVKMGLFFAHMSATATVVTGLLVVASVFIRGFWCRYLCPYGALLGLVSWGSPVRIGRTASACVGCKLCDRACMARITISTAGFVAHPECTGCLDCVAVCPVEGALELRAGRRRVTPLAFAASVLALFLAGYAGARTAGWWRSGMTNAEYVQRIQDIRLPLYAHPGVAGLEGAPPTSRP